MICEFEKFPYQYLRLLSGREDERRGLTVCEVREVSEVQVPQNSKLKRRKCCKVAVSPGKVVQIITSAPNVREGCKFIVALPGHTTETGVVETEQVGEFESFGRFCGPAEMGWDCDILSSQNAIILPDSAKVGGPVPSYDEAVAAYRKDFLQKIKRQERKHQEDMAQKDDTIRSLQNEMEKHTRHHQEEMAQRDDEIRRLSDDLRKLQMELAEVKQEQGKGSLFVEKDWAAWKYQDDNGGWTPFSDSQLIRDRKERLLFFP